MSKSARYLMWLSLAEVVLLPSRRVWVALELAAA
jgi:hypothetical protein